MQNFDKRECPLCSDGTIKEVVSPDINPDNNFEKIGKAFDNMENAKITSGN